MTRALPPLSARSRWANSRAAFPVHLTGAFCCGFQMDAIAVYRGVESVGVSVIVTASESAVPTRSEEAEESRTKMCKSSA
jgi:hypothetical protein